jgi:hypothetical protein
MYSSIDIKFFRALSMMACNTALKLIAFVDLRINIVDEDLLLFKFAAL